MSTRCNIIVQSGISGRNILYRHCDGYPDGGTGDDLKVVLEKYSKTTKEYDYETLTKHILDTYDDIREDDRVARDISYLYEITVFNHTIFYTCYKVPVIGDYDIDNIDEDENCSIIESKEYNNVYTDKSQLECTKDVIDDAKVLLDYANKRNYFIEQIIKKYKTSNTKDINLITELLKLSYDQGYNCSRLDNI